LVKKVTKQFHSTLCFSSTICSKRESMGVSETDFYGPNARRPHNSVKAMKKSQITDRNQYPWLPPSSTIAGL